MRTSGAIVPQASAECNRCYDAAIMHGPPVTPRRSPTLARAGLLAGLVSLWLATGVLAGPRIAGRPAVVHAGQVVRLSWEAPEEAEEAELLLLLGDGARETLRLTACFPGSSGSWEWRVPDLPAISARLVLRWGDGEREIEGEPGPSFAIVSRGRGLAPLAFRHGELWVGLGASPAIGRQGLAPMAGASWPSANALPATLVRHSILPSPGWFPAGARSIPAPRVSRAEGPGVSAAPLAAPLRE